MLSQIRVVLVFAATGLCLPSVSWAHPGHGTIESGPAHYVLEPVHALSIAALFAVAMTITGMALVFKSQRRTKGS